MKLKINYKLASMALTLFASVLCSVTIAQPVIKVPPSCNVVAVGSGSGTALGFGGIVGDGGKVIMKDPYQSATEVFSYIPNGTTQTGWTLQGDLSVYNASNVPPTPAIQTAGAVPTLGIESYNEHLRTSEGTAPSTSTLARSKGRIHASYSSAGCAPSSISFDVYKTYNGPGSGPNYVPPIIGPSCWLPNMTYTYSVDQIASDNLTDAIGLDSYYWTVTTAGGVQVYPPGVGTPYFASAYNSADNSSITVTTKPTIPAADFPFAIQLCYGRANPWDGDVTGAPHSTCVSYVVVSAPTAPTYTVPPPTCLNTGVSSFNVTYTPATGSTYTWTCSNSSWTLTPGTGSLAVTTLDDNPGILTLTVSGACLPATFTYTVTRSYNPAVTSISGPTCVTAGSANTYTITSPGSVLSNPTCWTLPSGWSFTPVNGSASIINLTVPAGTLAGSYTLSGYSCACPGGIVNLTINVKPAVPTGLSGPTCVTRNGGPTVTYSCAAVAGATSYTWSIPAGWTCVSGCTTNNPVFQPGGSSTGPVSISVIANGASGCNSNPSAAYVVNYNAVVPSSISAGCFSFGVAGTTTITVGSAPSPFFGTYTVASAPTGLFSSYSVNPSTGAITLSTLATASGTYTLLITHTTACGSSTTTPFTVSVTGNGATLTGIYNSSPGASDVYVESGAPSGSTYTWYINGVLVPGATGSALVLSSSTPPPGPICVYAAFGGCTTVACAAPGTHGLKESHTNNGNPVKQAFGEQVKVYPNPNPGTFKVQIPSFKTSATLHMVDALGRDAGDHVLNAGENTISENGLAPGIYYLILKSDDDVASFKIEILK